MRSRSLVSTPGAWNDRLFKMVIGSTLAVLGMFFGVLCVSVAGRTTTERFWSVLLSKEVGFALWLSVVTATLATLAAVVVSLPAAYVLSRTAFRGKQVVDTLLDLPIVMSPIALGAALMLFFNTGPGRAIDGRILPFVFEVPGLVLAQFTVVVALAVRLLKSAFDLIDERYERVGRVLGCTPYQAFRKIGLPMARPGIAAAVILTWARAMGEFGASATLAGATPMKTETLPIAIHLSFASADIEKAAALILVLVVVAGGALLAVRWSTAGEVRR